MLRDSSCSNFDTTCFSFFRSQIQKSYSDHLGDQAAEVPKNNFIIFLVDFVLLFKYFFVIFFK